MEEKTQTPRRANDLPILVPTILKAVESSFRVREMKEHYYSNFKGCERRRWSERERGINPFRSEWTISALLSRSLLFFPFAARRIHLSSACL